MKGGQSVECQGQIFGNAMSGGDLEMGVSSVDFTFCSPVACLPHPAPILDSPFKGRISSVKLIF